MLVCGLDEEFVFDGCGFTGNARPDLIDAVNYFVRSEVMCHVHHDVQVLLLEQICC